jgi:diguanylate cyclase (GGDEF)-like protein
MPATSIYDQVPQQIELLSQRRFRWPSFPEPLESRFEEETSAYRSARVWIEGLVAIGLFNLFLFANHFLLHTVSWHAVVQRTVLITPLALALNLMMRWNPRPFYREASIAVTVCWACFVHLYLERGHNALGPAYAQVGVIVAVLFANMVLRLRFPYALFASAGITVGDLVFLGQDKGHTPTERIFGASLMVCAVVMTLMANYSLAREERLGYLLRLRGELQTAALSTSNEELKRISRIDALTGLANRHAFGSNYMKLWKQALMSRTPLSAIMIDIDRFKTVNDMCGHLYGDQVLKRIAALIHEALRGKGDFAARFGGEEFVVLLPGSSPEVAMMVAERIRKLVEVAGAPALEEVQNLPALWATVSCGVSACWPTHTDLQDGLIEAADKALYQAKSNGRNCICYGEIAKDVPRGMKAKGQEMKLDVTQEMKLDVTQEPKLVV